MDDCRCGPPLSTSGVLVGRLCSSAEVLGGFWGKGLIIAAHKIPPRFYLAMTRSDDHLQDALPTQKLEWVTPKISLMEAGETATGPNWNLTEQPQGNYLGPS